METDERLFVDNLICTCKLVMSQEASNMASRCDSQSEHEPELDYSFSSFDEGQEDGHEKGVEHYRYEPYTSEESIEEGEVITRDIGNRLNTEWCLCTQCQAIPTAEESQCCHEITRTYDKITGFNETLQCITEHPGFCTVCLEQYVLETAYYQHIQQYDQDMEDSNERRQYVAYWQFILWCLGFLDKEVKVPLPACDVHRIRQSLPSDTYVRFQWPNYILNIETNVKTAISFSERWYCAHSGGGRMSLGNCKPDSPFMWVFSASNSTTSIRLLT